MTPVSLRAETAGWVLSPGAGSTAGLAAGGALHSPTMAIITFNLLLKINYGQFKAQ